MQRREGQTTQCPAGPRLTDLDSSLPVHLASTSVYVGDVLRGGLVMQEQDVDRVDRHERQQPAVTDVDYGQYYDHAVAVRRPCDVRRRHGSSDGATTWNDLRNKHRSSVCYNDSVMSPAFWPDNRSTAYCVL